MIGPSLRDQRWLFGGSDQEIFKLIFYGRPNGMPAFGGLVRTEDLYVHADRARRLPSALASVGFAPEEKHGGGCAGSAEGSSAIGALRIAVRGLLDPSCASRRTPFNSGPPQTRDSSAEVGEQE